MQSSPEEGWQLEKGRDQGKGCKDKGRLPRYTTSAQNLHAAAAFVIKTASTVSYCTEPSTLFLRDLATISSRKLNVAWLNQPLLKLEKRVYDYIAHRGVSH